jgi:hypothetical protein
MVNNHQTPNKVMKKIIVFALIALLATPSFAQYEYSRQRSRYNHNDTERYYGLRLGLNIASLSSDVADMDMDSRAGLAFGAVYGFQLANSAPVWLEVGAFYSEKGGESKYNNVKTRLTYFEVPLVCKYSFDVADDFYIQPFLGGYLAAGFAGKTKNYTERESQSSYNIVNRLDGGLRIGCGLEYQMVYAEAGFDFGLANISKDDFQSVRNRSFFLNVGVNF